MTPIARACALAVAIALFGAAPAVAAPFHSDNVQLVTKLPDTAGAASARFVGEHMYVSTWKGLSVFDISAADDPQRVGFLPLPHFENEDVDAAGDLVIISNDPSEGIGLIYVIDVSDPSLPTIRSIMPNGLITGDSLSEENPSYTGHIANCLQACKYLWLTGTSQGVVVIDLRDPDNPQFANTFQMPKPKAYGDETDPDELRPGFTHDVFVDRSGIAWVTGRDGTFGYDTADPVHPTLLYRSDENVTNTGLSGPDGDGSAPLDFLHHNSIRTEIQLAQPPVADGGVLGARDASGPVATTNPVGAGQRPAKHRRKARRHRRCHRRRGEARRHAKRRCARAKRRARRRAARRRAARRRAAARDTTARAAPPRGGRGDVLAVTEEDYTRPTCQGQGSLQTWQIRPGETNSDGTTKLTMLDQWTTELNELANATGRSPATGFCSAHWFDESRGVLAQGWYDQGVRFMDISDPRNIRQIGYWVTAGTFWAAYYAPTDPSRQVVYALDTAGGIDVLKLDRTAKPAQARSVRAPVLDRWLTTPSAIRFQPSAKWGYACPLLSPPV